MVAEGKDVLALEKGARALKKACLRKRRASLRQRKVVLAQETAEFLDDEPGVLIFSHIVMQRRACT